MGDVVQWVVVVVGLGLATLGLLTLLTLLDWWRLTPTCPECGRHHAHGPNHHHDEWPDAERIP